MKETTDRFNLTQKHSTFQRDNENDIIQGLKEQMLGDQKRKYDLLMRNRKEFMRDNHYQKQVKQDKEESEK